MIRLSDLRRMSPKEHAQALAKPVEEARKPAAPETIAELRSKRDNADNACSRAMYERILERAEGRGGA